MARAEKVFRCRVCKKTTAKNKMRKSSRGRTIPHCTNCRGKYRCTHCGQVKTSKHFKTHSSHRGKFSFADGEAIRIAVCYACDYQANRKRYARYDKRVQTSPTLKALILSNRQRWRAKTIALGQAFDLDYDYLSALWARQKGKCAYSGIELSCVRGRLRDATCSASLDRIDPALGYIRGNVVWASFLVNTSKGPRSAREFFEFCDRVRAHRRGLKPDHPLAAHR